MWTLNDGRLYCGRDRVSVRRSVVEAVGGNASGPIHEETARVMLRLERLLSLRGLSAALARPSSTC
mgnify:CR=1 FL=1